MSVGEIKAKEKNLAAAATSALAWSGGFTLLRDLAQFAVMLVLVRLLSPADYGNAALAQSIVGLASTVSFAPFSYHALQLRNPAGIDWQSHFTAATAINFSLFLGMMAVAWGLSLTTAYHNVAAPLAALSVVFLIEIPGTLRHRMLEALHEWRRFRILLTLGALLGLGVGLIVAMMGGGVWALIVQPPMFGVPGAVDLFVGARFRPTWTWSRARYHDAACFGFNRIGAAVPARTRQMAEHVLLSNTYDLAILGVFTRAVGLSALLAGRIGSVAIASIYPVITRADQGSARFQRMAGLALRGICWTTAPSAAFLAIAANDIVGLLYGPKWAAVIPLLPLAATAVGLGGVVTALSNLLLANNEANASLRLELLMVLTGIAIMFFFIPLGLSAYLIALCCQVVAMIGIAIALLLTKNGVTPAAVVAALAPPVGAATAAVAAVWTWHSVLGVSSHLLARLVADALLFAAAYIAILRVAFARPLLELLEVAPGGQSVARCLLLPRSVVKEGGLECQRPSP